MYNIIRNYCENDSGNGLFLIDMPTGFGKTYSVLKYISDACKEEKNKKRKYFFITPLKKNLPVNELKKFFEETSETRDFSEKVLVIRSNIDMVMENYDKIANSIPDDIRKTDECKKFMEQLSFLKSIEKDNKFRQVYEESAYKFRTRTEPDFRKMLQRKLSARFGKSNKKAKLDAVEKDKQWQWLEILYPTVFTDNYQIYFMSMDKFITRNSTIVEPSYMFVNSALLDDAVIFIDEFDSSKETILNNIIQNSLNGRIDFIEMFRSIYSAMNANELPSVYTTPSEKRNKSRKSLKEIVDDTKRKAQEIYNEYAIYYNYRTAENTDNSGRNFMFQDYRFHSLIDGDKNYIYTFTDENKKLNFIDFSHSKKEDNNIHSLIRAVKGFIRWFQGTVNILAINYKHIKDEQGKEYFTLEQAVRTVLSEFHLKENYTEYLLSQIMLDSYRPQNNILADSAFDLSVHENGFRYYCFEDDSAHDMQTKMMMQSFNNTPEKMLLRFCEKAKVIGISATATLPTVIGNFDIDYLRTKMGDSFHTISEKDFSRLSDDFKRSQSGYDKIKINSELLGASGYSVKTWQNIVNDKETAEKIYDMLDIRINERGTYYKERYARIAMAFRKFLEHDDIRSFLCFLTTHPDEKDTLDKDRLTEIFEYISKDFPDSDYDKDNVEILKGAGYDTKKDDIIRKLADGKKIFVISTYQTIGAGQNLQYPVPKNLKGRLVCSDNSKPQNEKDFDAVYLDKPTHLIVNQSEDWEEKDFIKYIFQMEFLHESYEISDDDKWNNIRDAFKYYYSLSKCINKNYDHIESVRLYATRIIIQAIGRICRTNQKNQNIYIFADEKIADMINPSVTEGRIFNPEFVSLCYKIKEVQKNYSVPDNLQIRADIVSERASRHIDNVRNNNNWTFKTISEWKMFRDFLLRLPTMSGQEENYNIICYNYFVQLPAPDNMLYYLQSDDFHKINISFTPKPNYSILNEEKTRLNLFMKWKPLREYFIEKGYATEFKPNEYIMSPAVWNNIYKGALGEEAGKFWFSEILGIDLEELDNPEIFELFDFKIPDKQIFIDFKNWSENFKIELQETLDNIFNKGTKCDCRLAVIVNILSTENYKITTYKQNGIEIIVVPSLLRYNNDIITIDENSRDCIRRCLDEYTD